MPSPFPGMDPYLERPGLWPDVHHGLISEIRASLNQQLGKNYVATVKIRTYISDDDDPGQEVLVPDIVLKLKRRKPNALAASIPATTPSQHIILVHEEIKEAYIEIKAAKSKTPITAIEVLRPTDKVIGSAGRQNFLSRRREIMASEIHWVEIDLLRAGKPTALNATRRPNDYRIIVSRGSNHFRAQYWPLSVRQTLPIIPIPLSDKDADVPVDLGVVLRSAYDHGAYDRSIDYTNPSTPPLTPDDAKWANKLLKEKGLR